MVSIEQQKK